MNAIAKFLCGICLCLSLSLFAAAQGAHRSTVTKISVSSLDPFQLRVQTNAPVVPQVKMISSPERLVIDFPNSTPGAGLHGLVVNHGGVREVRTGLFSTSPPTTRIVVDLNGPEWYRIVPDSSGLLVSLGGDGQNAVQAPQPTIGWLSTNQALGGRATRPAVVTRNTPSAPGAAAGANGVIVRFANGALSIHAANATLSEVLFQIQKITGAEIAIPSGTEQQRVAADFGPGTPSEVLGELLNGSGLNFVVVGSQSNPNILRSVILSRNTGAADPPSAFAQPNVPAAAEEAIPNAVVPDPPPPQQPAVENQLQPTSPATGM